MQIKFDSSSVFEKFSAPHSILVLPVTESDSLLKGFEALDQKSQGQLTKAIQKVHFKGEKGEILRISAPLHVDFTEIVFVGLGKEKDITAVTLEEVGAKIFSTFHQAKYEEVVFFIPSIPHDSFGAAALASGLELRSWTFDHYKTVKKNPHPGFAKALFFVKNVKETEDHFSAFHVANEGNVLTRTVVNEPPNVIYPASFAKKAKDLESLGVRVEILGEEEMKKLGMNALLGVGQGSEKESQLVVLQWKGADDKSAPVAFVGKGVTFDTGGISIKPSANMDEMKADMAGAGAILGLFKTLALRKSKAHVVGVLGLVENMPSGTAQRPGDIVYSMSGQTIEILNTDAEGRLVLADALWYTQDRFKPKLMVDLATLTGAITVSLGHEYAGLFSNSDEFSEYLIKAGEKTGERLWRLPMGKGYDKDIDSDVADVKNIGSGRGAGSITAAQFLKRFVNDLPWAHLDIAAVAYETKDKPLTGKGATGFGVRLLNEFVKTNFEN